MPNELPFQSVMLDLSDPRDAAALILALMNRESELRMQEQMDDNDVATSDDDWPVTSEELLDQAQRLMRLRLSVEEQMGDRQ